MVSVVRSPKGLLDGVSGTVPKGGPVGPPGGPRIVRATPPENVLELGLKILPSEHFCLRPLTQDSY